MIDNYTNYIMESQLAILPLDYYPCDFDESFKDSLDEFTSLQFKDFGVKCGCNGKIYYNKYTFKAQHIKTAKHSEYLNKLSVDKPNLIQTIKENQKTMKLLKVQLGMSDQKLTQNLEKIKVMNVNIQTLMDENKELKTQLTDRDEYIDDMLLTNEKEKECILEEKQKIELKKKKYEEKNTKVETILKHFMELYDYEVD